MSTPPLVTLTWRGLPPDPRRAHWAVVRKAKRAWQDEAWVQLAEQGALRHRAGEGEPRRVRVTFYRPGPVSDTDNAYSRCKVPLDVLTRSTQRKPVGLGLLWDDDPAHCEVEARTVSAKPSRTVVEIWR